jgi:hypothetical protein
MKTFKQYLKETPPPPDWDTKIFKSSYKKQIDYALARAAKLGSGSSRVVFDIQYEGRSTVLKIAKNAKGLAQNMKEADWGLYRMYPDITVPLLDVDEDNEDPKWIHLEKADKLTKPLFKSITGFPFDDFANMLYENEDDRLGRKGYKRRWNGDIDPDLKEKITASELYYDVTDLMVNFDITSGDLGVTRNWGIYKGNPVIIDLGLDSDVYKTHYDRGSKW